LDGVLWRHYAPSVPQRQAPRSSAVPFIDLSEQHDSLKDDLLADLADLIESGAFTNGPAVARFERAFAEYCAAAHCVGVASGLDAIRLALIGSGLQDRDEVIVPANTFVATAEAVTQAGGVPVIADVTDSDYNVDVSAAAAAVTEKTAGVVPVHLYGQMADMVQLSTLASRHGLLVVEDACQAHGAVRDGIRAGTSGTAGAFSFYPAKNLGAMGDAGALVTNDPGLAYTVTALREHGQHRKYEHDLGGYTARLDTLQATVLLRKLPLLDAWNEERRAVAAFYVDALAGVGDLRLPAVAPGSDPVWHLFVVRTSDPERLATSLHEKGIATGRHYPQPIHLTPAYAHLGYRRGAFPVAEALAAECLSLPLFPGMSDAQRHAVVAGVSEFFHDG
jgi:dTDP-4-amino-4,6-dideoxygalactose transaminase